MTAQTVNTQTTGKPVRYCGRLFTTEEMDWIRRLMASEPKLNRAQLSRRVCSELHWLRPDGRSKEMSCRVAMLRMQRDGLITLPRPEKGNGNGRNRPRLTTASDPKEPLTLPARAVTPLEFRPVDTPGDSLLWNELIERYHYLKYKPLPGAQMRYLLFHGSYLLAALGFSAAAKRLGTDWTERYGYEPVLLETFVERSRFRGTCYRAANWVYVGQTQGRGKLDRHHRGLSTVKHIYLYPLHKGFRHELRLTPSP